MKTLDKRKYEVIHTLGPTVLALVNNYVAQHLPDIGVGDEAKGRVAKKLDEALKGLL